VTPQTEQLLAVIRRGLAGDQTLTAINFHNTPQRKADEYDRQFALIAEHFAPTREDDLAHYLSSGSWPTAKPGIVLAFYNGYRNNFDVAYPLLEKHGLVGWFLVASGYVSCPPAEQLAFGKTRTLRTMKDEYLDGRYALSWDECRTLDRNHVVGSHTRNHTRVSLDNALALDEEIVGSQADFTSELGHPVRSFAWLFGGAYGENPLADFHVDRAGYEFLFSNYKVQRLPQARR
jgi:peptidoglycan/xylan/chitin deacetylase (PgdA/CDA1 family)